MTFNEALYTLHTQPLFVFTMIAMFGVCAGSFINVVIYRVPIIVNNNSPTRYRNFSLSTPRSHCPHCGTVIRWWWNIPIISFFLLGGTSACCKQTISLRYPIIEFIAATITLYCVYHYGLSLQFVGASFFCYGLLALFTIDLNEMILPDNITLFMLWLGLFFNIFETFTTLNAAVLGAISGYLFLWVIGWSFKQLRGNDGLGYGDYKLLAMIGAWLGWQALPLVVLLSSFTGIIFCSVGMIMRKQKLTDKIPFGPFLTTSAALILFIGERFL